jgi:hypothetical protein
MANSTLTLPGKVKLKHYVVRGYIYNALNSRPLPIGAVVEFADNRETENLVRTGFLVLADAATSANAKAINASLDLKPSRAMPATPPFITFPFNPSAPIKG